MEIVNRSGNPLKPCQNCDLPCGGLFCCEWCVQAYLDRREINPAGLTRNNPLPTRESLQVPQRRLSEK